MTSFIAGAMNTGATTIKKVTTGTAASENTSHQRRKRLITKYNSQTGITPNITVTSRASRSSPHHCMKFWFRNPN